MIPAKNTTVPQAVGPMLDQVSTLLKSIPKDRLPALLDETFKALNGTADDLGTLVDSASRLTAELNGVADQSRTLIEDSRPLLDGQLASTDSHPHVGAQPGRRHRATDHQRPADAAPSWPTGPVPPTRRRALLNQIKPTLPVLLANLTTMGQVA